MDDFWDIFVPILIIGSIFVGVFTENKKNAKRAVPPQNQHNEVDIFAQNANVFDEETDVIAKEEGVSVFNHKKEQTPPRKTKKKVAEVKPKQSEDAYAMLDTDSDASVAIEDARRAMIAHEILKRKF